MKLSDFDFSLPKSLIAQAPARPRDHARLLVYNRQTSKITDDYFYNLEKYLPPGSTMVLNDTKVEKCRLLIGNTEVFVLESKSTRVVRALVRPGKKFKAGAQLNPEGVGIKVLEVEASGIRLLEFDRPLKDKTLGKFTHTPFPPYIKQNDKLSSQYQTVYAGPPGSKAAPTAGLHFSKKLLSQISANHPVAKITLSVGLGTFMPISQADIVAGKLHHEAVNISAATARSLASAKHITAIGTTTARALETMGWPPRAYKGLTDIFIMPGYKFKVVDALVTNFHLPKSSLLMLVSAHLGSVDKMHRLYEHAIKHQYRFYSFGDAMLIL